MSVIREMEDYIADFFVSVQDDWSVKVIEFLFVHFLI